MTENYVITATHLPSPVRVRPSTERMVSGMPSDTTRKPTSASSDIERFWKDKYLKSYTTRKCHRWFLFQKGCFGI